MKGLGEKDTFTGIVRRENGIIVLDTGRGPSLEITANGFNPQAEQAALEPFVGKRVSVKGRAGSGRAVIFVDSFSDITPIHKQGRPNQRPPQP